MMQCAKVITVSAAVIFCVFVVYLVGQQPASTIQTIEQLRHEIRTLEQVVQHLSTSSTADLARHKTEVLELKQNILDLQHSSKSVPSGLTTEQRSEIMTTIDTRCSSISDENVIQLQEDLSSVLRISRPPLDAVNKEPSKYAPAVSTASVEYAISRPLHWAAGQCQDRWYVWKSIFIWWTHYS